MSIAKALYCENKQIYVTNFKGAGNAIIFVLAFQFNGWFLKLYKFRNGKFEFEYVIEHVIEKR